MMPVELHDGRRLEFPDGTDPAVIQRTVKKLLSSQEASAESSGGTLEAAIDTGNAIGTGYGQALTRLAGLPVDTVANVLDLGKAALGAPYVAATGRAPPEWLQLTPRSEVVGSGQNLIDSATRTRAGQVLLRARNPEYEGGYLQAGGAGLAGIMSPNTTAQAVNQGVNAVASTLMSKGVADATGNEALAITAAMFPNAAQNAAIASTKQLVRGGENGRLGMQQRILDLRRAGIEQPTLGLASGNRLIGGTENLLQSTPGAVGIMQRNRDAALNALESRTLRAADAASTNRGALESGRSIQAGAKTFKDDVKLRQERLYDELGRFIPDDSPVNVDATRAALKELNADIPTMPELSKQFKNSRIQAIERALVKDMSEIKAKPDAKPPVEAREARTEIPFEAVKKTRTLVGGEIADNSMLSDVPRSKWKPLYRSLSSDIEAAADAAGANRAFDRANDYTRSSIRRMERVAPIVDRPAPEQSFAALSSTLKENASTFQAVKKSLPPDARGDFAATVIERLGKARSGQQNELGDRWSPETFLTNWNNMKPKARDELLSGFKNAPQVKEDIDAVARATALMRDNSKMWANPSGTGANTFARGTLGAIGAGGAAALLGIGSPAIPLAAAGTVGASNLLARALTSPRVVNSMASRTYVDPELQNALARALTGGGLLSNGEYE